MNTFMGIIELICAGYWGWWAYAAYTGAYEPSKLSLLCAGIVAALSMFEGAIRYFLNIP